MTEWLNWVDLVVLTIFLRTLYNGFARGVLTELVTIAGAVAVTVVTINLWGTVAVAVGPWLPLPHDAIRLLAFWLLFLGLWLGVRQLRVLIGSVVKWEHFHWTIQGLGVCLGGLRGFWWAGFVLLVLTSSGYPFLQDAVQERSVLGPRILTVFQPYLQQAADLVPGAENRGAMLVPPVRPVIGGK